MKIRYMFTEQTCLFEQVKRVMENVEEQPGKDRISTNMMRFSEWRTDSSSIHNQEDSYVSTGARRQVDECK